MKSFKKKLLLLMNLFAFILMGANIGSSCTSSRTSDVKYLEGDVVNVASADEVMGGTTLEFALADDLGLAQTCLSEAGEECFSTVDKISCQQDAGMGHFSFNCEVSFTDSYSDTNTAIKRTYNGIPGYTNFIPCLEEKSADNHIIGIDRASNTVEIKTTDTGYEIKRCEASDVTDEFVVYSVHSCYTYEVVKADVCKVTGHGSINDSGRLYRINGIPGSEFCSIKNGEDYKSGCRNAPGMCVTDEGPYDVAGKGIEGVIDTTVTSKNLKGWRTTTDSCAWLRP